jgi:hypothetical protein
MDWQHASERADQILDEERRFPTVGYVSADTTFPRGEDFTSSLLGTVAGGLAHIRDSQELLRLRTERPRPIVEDTRRYTFRSVNYNLLRALLSTLPEESTLNLVQHALVRLVLPPACTPTQAVGYPAWNGITSELPLIAEFVVRNGCKESFISMLAEATPIPAHVLLLRQLEEMISLEFTLFTSGEYERLSLSVGLFGERASRRSEEVIQKKLMEQRPSDFSLPRAPEILKEMISASNGLVEQCRKARFLYVKGELEEGLNLEINQDKDVVVSYLQKCGFSSPLSESLNQADRLYRGQATAFDLKSCMGHLRSFLESVHKEAVPALHAKFGGTLPKNWGEESPICNRTGCSRKPRSSLLQVSIS